MTAPLTEPLTEGNARVAAARKLTRRAGRDALRVGTAGSLAHAQHRSPELTPERPHP